MDIVVARKTLLCERPDGSRTPIEIAIGRPFKVANETWSCPLTVEGLDPVGDGLGTDSWDALTVAIGVARQHLEHSLATGVRLLGERDEAEVDLDDLFPQF